MPYAYRQVKVAVSEPVSEQLAAVKAAMSDQHKRVLTYSEVLQELMRHWETAAAVTTRGAEQ